METLETIKSNRENDKPIEKIGKREFELITNLNLINRKDVIKLKEEELKSISILCPEKDLREYFIKLGDIARENTNELTSVCQKLENHSVQLEKEKQKISKLSFHLKVTTPIIVLSAIGLTYFITSLIVK